MPSIRLRLLKWLIGPILLINLAGGALTYVLAWLPAQTAFDQSLLDAAGALIPRLRQAGGGLKIDLPQQAEQVLRADATDAIYFVVRGAAGNGFAGDPDFPVLRPPLDLKNTLAYDGAMRGEGIRIVALNTTVGAETVTIGVAKTLRKRQQIRHAIFRALILLETMLTLASIGLIWFSVTNGLLPLQRMRGDLNARSGEDFSPIRDDQVPFELVPVVSAFNGLLDKVHAGAKAQHDFLANVAHQLRTPLAGLKFQLEWLGQRHEAESETMHSIKLMLSSTERMIRQTNQLLALARAEPSHFEKARLEPLELNLLVEESVQQFVEEAAKKRIDLGFNLARTVVVGERFMLRDLIDNLIDNAIRYTPQHGTVTVSCIADALSGRLVVEDSGPGIPPAKRELVFNRFVRLDDKITGSGLGLAIVRDIALAHGASITLDSRPGRPGCIFSVRFPA